jgi:uncharacterized protein with von Willebrand factor type A (vWA) domain
MKNFSQAMQDHGNVEQASHENATRAEAIWRAVSGFDGHAHGSFPDAILESLPTKYTLMLSRGDSPTAFAFDLFWSMMERGLSGFSLREATRKKWEDFCEKAEHARPLVEGLGCDASLAFEHVRDCQWNNQKLEMIERIAKLAGRMFAALQEARANQPSQAPEEIYSVELGNVLGRLLPSELAHLGQPTEVCLIERIAERKALQYAVRGEETVARGPLVIALDESGSMRGYRNEWAKAAAVALCRVALKDGRCCSVVHYSTSCQVTYLKPGDDEAVFALITHFLSGGTEISRALSRSADEVSALERKGERGADVVLVSDGEDYDSGAHEKAIKKIQKLGSKLWTVAIQCSLEQEAPLRKLAHKYVELETSNLVTGDVMALQGVVNPA